MSQKFTLPKLPWNPEARERILKNAHDFLDRLPLNKSWRIEVKEARKERTPPQNAALWGVAYPVLTEVTGYSAEELHHEFCGRYFGWEIVDMFGQQRRRPRRTTTMNEQGERDVLPTAEFARFYEFIQQMGAEAGIDVPSPDPFHGESRWAA